jgi:hypothetical protein
VGVICAKKSVQLDVQYPHHHKSMRRLTSIKMMIMFLLNTMLDVEKYIAR